MIQQDNHRPVFGPTALLIAALFAVASVGCDDSLEITNAPATIVAAGNISAPLDECPRMSSTRSSALSDAGTTDAGTTDAGTTDAGTTDAGTTDAGTTDAGTTDAGVSDAGDVSDGGVSDTGVSDAGDVSDDAGVSDAGDTQPTPSRVVISRNGDALVLPYLIKDIEGDDQAIKVEICQWDGQEATACGVAVQARGGDGSTFIPTTPAGSCILHLFYWDVGCGRFVGTDGGASPSRAMIDSVDDQLVARVSVVGSDEAPRQTEPFSLADIGFDSLPECD
jgi:hypothetical protein